MTTISGTPNVDVELTSGGEFRVRPSPGAPPVFTVPDAGTISLNPTGLVRLGADLEFTTGPRREVRCSTGLDLSGTSVRIGNGVTWWDTEYDPLSGELSFETVTHGVIRGLLDVNLDGGPAWDDQQPTFGTLLKVRQNGSPSQDRVEVLTRNSGGGRDGEIVLRGVQTTNGWAMRIEARTDTGAPMPLTLFGDMLLDGPVEVSGDTRVVGSLDVDGATTLKSATRIEADLEVQGNVDIETSQPHLQLTDTATSTTYRLESGSALNVVREASSVSTTLLSLQRSNVPIPGAGTEFITTLEGPPPATTGGDAETGRILFGNRATLRAQDGDAEVVGANASVTLRREDSGGLAEAVLTAGDLAAPSTTHRISLVLAGNGVLRFGRFTGAGGGSVDDRFRMETNGRIRTYDAVSTGSPGADPVLDFDPTTTSNEAILNVGQGLGTSGTSRGRVVARRGSSSNPGLLVLEADDGTPVYLSAWSIGGGTYDIRASLAVPNSSGAGVRVAQV